MPLHIYFGDSQTTGSAAIVALSFEVLAEFGPGIKEFLKQTGVRVSEYDDCRLSYSQFKLLAALIEQNCIQLSPDALHCLEKIHLSLSTTADDTYFVGSGE